jgi:hypothetical protein
VGLWNSDEIENAEVPSVLKCCPIEMLLSQIVAGVKKSY